MGKVLVFSWKHGVPAERQATFLEEVNGWKGVSSTGHVEPEADDPEDRGICFVQLTPETNEERLIKRLEKNAEVEEVSVQPERYAATG